MKTKTVSEHDAVPPSKDPALSGWIGKEASLAAKGTPLVINPDDGLEVIDPSVSDPVTHSGSSGSSSVTTPDENIIIDEVDEPRELS